MNNNQAFTAKQSFCEWFNPHDIDHIQAYIHLQRNGAWPEGFKPEQIWMEPSWQALLAFKLANAWIDYKLMEK